MATGFPSVVHYIRLLGGTSIERSDVASSRPVVQRARMAMLVALALSRTRSASRERLMSLLWPEHETDRARHLLRESLYRLRGLLGQDALLTDGDEIRLNGAIRCDIWEFEAAVDRRDWVEADRVCAGPLLDGFFLTDAPDFERLVSEERRRLADLHGQAMESRAAECGARHEWPEAIALWRRRAAADPFNAGVVLRLMEALDAVGDRAGALKHAATHAALLESELGAAPDPAVTAFAERLRRDPVRKEPHRSDGKRTGTLADDRSLLATPVAVPIAGDRYDAIPQAPEVPGWPRAKRSPRRVMWPVAAGMAVVMTAGLIGLRGGWDLPALDDNRIAILPVRVPAADPGLLVVRDALVELLPLQFNGAAGPVAVDPGEVLPAWRRSGADDDENVRGALRVAAELGAGQVTYGALVGTPQRFTVTFSVRTVNDGAIRVVPVRIEGSLDSLGALVTEIATRLQAPYTDSSLGDVARVTNEALRAFVDGMSEYRKGNWETAGTRLFRAFEIDSTFLHAAYRFTVIHARTVPLVPLDKAPASFADPAARPRTCGGPKQKAACWMNGLLWKQRDRLSDERRILLESIADSVNIFWHQEQLPRLERAVDLLPNSAEAWELLGDAYYHAGGLLGRTDWAERSKRAFDRAWTLDSTIALKAPSHLADLAFFARDSRSHARYSRLVTGSEWPWENFTGDPGPPRGPMYRRYQAAILSGNAAALREARVGYSHAWARGEVAGADWAIRGMTIRPHELDSLLAQMATDATSDDHRLQVDSWLSHAAAMTGRPNRASGPLQRATLPDSFHFYITQLAWAEGDSAATEQLAALMRVRPLAGVEASHPAACSVALSRLRRGDTTGVSGILATQPPLDDTLPVQLAFARRYRRGLVAQQAICALVARGVLASLTTHGITPLLRADSLMSVMPLNYADWWNYDLALALARHSEYGRAATAVRRHFHDTFPLQRLVLLLRQEGRWAALAGDTAAAVKALRHYLVWRSDPEPVFIPQRDSVRTELAALERGQGIWRRWLRW